MQQEMDCCIQLFYGLWNWILSHKISHSVPFTITLRSPAFVQLEGKKTLFIQYIASVLGEVYRKFMFGYSLSIEYSQLMFLDPYTCKICLRLLWTSMSWIQFRTFLCGLKATFSNLYSWKRCACGISEPVSWTDSLCSIALNLRGVSLPKRWGVVSYRSQ